MKYVAILQYTADVVECSLILEKNKR